jgi:pSer/pThr/pTyr-binding forkhead associated (FHA) protein
MQARLVHIENGATVSTRPIREDAIVIGRDGSSDLVVAFRGVSRHHVTIECVEQGHAVRDLGSTNGTRLNGDYLSEPALLRSGDVIRLGEDVTFVYELEERKGRSFVGGRIAGCLPGEIELAAPARSPMPYLVLGLTLGSLGALVAARWLGLL